MPPCSCATPGRKPGTSTKVTSGTLNASQVRTKRAAFTDASMSSAPARTAGCCATMPTARPPSRANPTRMFAAHAGWISRNAAVVDDATQDVVHVVRLRRLVGDDVIELCVHAISCVARLDRRCVGEVVLRQVREQASDRLHRLGLVAGREMRDAAASGVDTRAAERLGIDDLVGHGAHDVRPGDEHVARPLDHHREVRDGRRVHRAAGARPEDHRDLRHDARRHDVAQEDLRVAAQRRDALLDPRTAGIVEADDRRADLHRQVHDLADLLGVRLRQRAPEDREVLAVDEDQSPVDGPVARDDAIAEDALPVGAELRGPVGDERVELREGAVIEQEVQALARRQLARGVLALDPDRSPALERLGSKLLEAGHPLRVGRHVPTLPWLTLMLSLRKDVAIAHPS